MTAREARDGGHDRTALRERRGITAPDVDAYAELAAALRGAVDGDVRFDEYSQVLYASDGSIYEARPAGVVIPRSVADVRETVRVAAEHDVPVLPRGAGSSLAGQAVGPGCVVVDCSTYLDEVIDIDPEARRATVQPGVVQDDLDAALAPHGLKFAPDPASSNRATIGGGIGNNSTGAHSVRYGITDAYVDALSVVLADGSLIRTREVVLDSPEWDDLVAGDDREARIYRAVRAAVEDHRDEIDERYPDLDRNVSGYNLDRVIYENDDGERCINLSRLVVGAEGTLGIVVEATLSLVTVPDETVLAVYCYDDLVTGLAAVPTALECGASAVELMDAEVVRLAAASDGYAHLASRIPDGTAAAIMVEFDTDLHDDLRAAVDTAIAALHEDGDAFAVVEAFDADAQADLWALRTAAIPLLMRREGDAKPYPFIEDATVPPDALAEYVTRFEVILDDHGTEAAYFAHAGAGTLHIRPVLNLKTGQGVETMRSIAGDVTDLVLEYHGSFSGEHGDGMARTEFTPTMYGPALWRAFKDVKTAFDPAWLLHPGNVVYRDGPDDVGPDSARGVGADMRENLRYGPAYASLEPETALDFDDEGGFSHLVELCNGCGTCRMTGTGTMCPTYRASREEIESTRGRANLLRAAISGELPADELHAEVFQASVLDLCIGCKGCKTDCPTGVDMAKLKAEVKHRHHDEAGVTFRERAFGNVDGLAGLASRVAPVANRVTAIPGARWLLERTLGISRERRLPTFARESFPEWYDRRGGPGIPEAQAVDRVVLVPDTFTSYVEPGIARAGVRVLEAAGVHVTVPEGLAPTGRAAYSQGLLDVAADRARRNVDALAPLVAEGWTPVSLEPADAVMLQDEYPDLLGSDDVTAVAGAAMGVLGYVDHAGLVEALDITEDAGRLVYHGHCNQKAMRTAHHAATVLGDVGYAVEALDSGCCGMAGSFGYEAEHYDLSMAIGGILAEEVREADGDRVVASGASCRAQLAALLDDRPRHPIEAVDAAAGGEDRRATRRARTDRRGVPRRSGPRWW